MMSGEVIRQMSDEAAQQAAANQMLPTVVWSDETLEDDLRGIPNLGDYVPYGWRMAECNEFETLGDSDSLFVDSSGWGSAGELAMTPDRFYRAVRSLIAEATPKTLGFALVEVGQFQVYVGVFVRER